MKKVFVVEVRMNGGSWQPVKMRFFNKVKAQEAARVIAAVDGVDFARVIEFAMDGEG